MARAALGTRAHEHAAAELDALVLQQRDRRTDRGQAALALTGAEAEPKLAPVGAGHASRRQRVLHLVPVMERRIGEEEDLVARVRPEPADDVVEPVDLHLGAERLECGRGDVAREATEPGIRRVDPVLAARNERVGGHELFEPLPEAVDVDASSHSANAGMIDDPNASTSAEGSVYDSKWRM